MHYLKELTRLWLLVDDIQARDVHDPDRRSIYARHARTLFARLWALAPDDAQEHFLAWVKVVMGVLPHGVPYPLDAALCHPPASVMFDPHATPASAPACEPAPDPFLPPAAEPLHYCPACRKYPPHVLETDPPRCPTCMGFVYGPPEPFPLPATPAPSPAGVSDVMALIDNLQPGAKVRNWWCPSCQCVPQSVTRSIPSRCGHCEAVLFYH